MCYVTAHGLHATDYTLILCGRVIRPVAGTTLALTWLWLLLLLVVVDEFKSEEMIAISMSDMCMKEI